MPKSSSDAESRTRAKAEQNQHSVAGGQVSGRETTRFFFMLMKGRDLLE